MSGAEQTEARARKLLSLQDFLSIGYVQEVNRRFFHPLGLALCVVIDDDRGTAEICVWDYREDPEGVVFSSDLVKDQDAIDKAGRIFGMQEARRAARVKALGFWIQPAGATLVDQFRSDPDKAALLECEERALAAEERLAKCRAETCASAAAGIGVLLDREDKHSRLRESINRMLERIANVNDGGNDAIPRD